LEILRTPDACFANVPDFAYAPRYIELEGLRIHYVDEGPRSASPVLLMHGEPSWSFLYRKMIPGIVAAGHRAIAPDLVGFGRSDKPSRPEDYTYERHVAWMAGVVTALDLRDVTLFCQDWGGLIGLRLVAEHPERFARVVAANTALPTGDQPMPDAFLAWQSFAESAPEFDVGKIVRRGCFRPVSPDVVAAYDAPFPEERYKAGARRFPQLVPTRPDDPAAEANRAAWRSLQQFARPLLTAFSDSDPITQGAERVLQKRIPGADGQPHVTIARAGHFLQEDAGAELTDLVVRFIARSGGQGSGTLP
jgi:haloalkane dehalogenase